MKFSVKVWTKDSILDTQGRAVTEHLKRKHEPVKDVKIGKWIVLDIDAQNSDEGLAKAKEIAETLLHNPLIEQYQIDVL